MSDQGGERASSELLGSGFDLVVAGLAAGCLLGGAVVWATTALAGLLGSGHVVRLPLADLPRAVVGVASHLSNPAAGYATHVGRLEAVAPWWWLSFAVVVGSVLGLVVPAAFCLRRWSGAVPHSGRGATWATRSDLRPLRVKAPAGGRVILGKSPYGPLATEAQHSVMVFGPAGSAKTTGVAIPAVLEWGGPVLSVSVKGDVLEATHSARVKRGGRIQVFDPTDASFYPGASWSPLRSCSDFEEACRIGQAMAQAAHTASGADLRDDSFWYEGAASVLALYLYAAASYGGTIDQVVRWVSRQDYEAVAPLIEGSGNAFAEDAWTALWTARDQLRKDYFATAVSALRAFGGPRVRESLQRAEIDFSSFLDGAPNTIYVAAPLADQHRLRPLFSAFVTEALDAIYARASRSGPPEPPVLVVIDEAANVAPLAQLPQVASTARSHGIQLITIWQDMAQAEERYRSSARTLFNNHRAKLLLSGCADLTTVQYFSHLLGEVEVQETSTHRDPVGRRSSTDAPRRRALAPVEWIRQMRPGEALLVYGAVPPTRLRLRLSWAERSLKARVGDPPPRAFDPALRTRGVGGHDLPAGRESFGASAAAPGSRRFQPGIETGGEREP